MSIRRFTPFSDFFCFLWPEPFAIPDFFCDPWRLCGSPPVPMGGGSPALGFLWQRNSGRKKAEGKPKAAAMDAAPLPV